MSRQLEKYLRTRAVRAPWQLAGTNRSNFKAAIIIPALAEAGSLPQTISSFALNRADLLQQTLFIVVVNNRTSASDELKTDNQVTLQWLRDSLRPQLNLAWVDAASPGLELPEKEGVGLARKIGFDLALTRLDWQKSPLLISLDADTLVAENYLAAIFQHFDESCCGGATVPFRHQAAADPPQEAAIRHYELYLRSYLFGLQLAGSPYAYHTIGSAIACRADAYLAAGGMNRRQAAEDFYFLQQLAKTSGVEMLTGTLVSPSPRFSSRVPFGTGKAVQGQLEEGRQMFRFSSAAAFALLRQWLQLVADHLDRPAEGLLAAAGKTSGPLQAFLQELNFNEVWARLQQNHTNPAARRQAFHCWFDGLRTRQLLVCLDVDEKRSGESLVAELLAWGNYPGRETAAEQLRLLECLQGVEKY